MGEFFSNSLSDSVHQTVLKRNGIAKQSIYEIRAVVEDTRANKIGAMNVALEIWDKSILPMLFFNSECWFDISNKTMKLLKGLFNQFFSSIFRISGCPSPSFYWSTATNTVYNHILQRKLVFWHHVKNMPGSLASEVADLHMNNNGMKGTLFSEIREYIEQMGNPDVTTFTKSMWRHKVKSFIKSKNRNDLLLDMKSYKKINYDICKNEVYEKKSYFFSLNLEQSRAKFRVSYNMVQKIRKNYPGMYKGKSLACQWCINNNQYPTESVLEPPAHTQDHVFLICPAYQDLRDRLDIHNSDVDVIEFFRIATERLTERESDDS